MANYYNINRSVEAYEFRTIDPNNGQLRNILDIAGSGGGGGGGFFLSSTSKKKRPLGRSLFGNKHTPSEALFLQFSGQGIGKFETI